MTLMFRIFGFESEQFEKYIDERPDQWRGVYGLWELIQEAESAGELNLQREDLLFFATPNPEEVSVNSTRVTEVFGTEVWDLTYAEWHSRKQMQQIAAFLRRRVPGFDESFIGQSGVQIGVRETRRIKGLYTLDAEDLLTPRRFPDVIARGSYPLDIHNPSGKGTILKRLPPGEFYEIPLRSLIPREPDNLLVAGRCISGTHEAHSSYRIMPVSMATGQAAGVCAAIAAVSERAVKDVPSAEVQQVLLSQGAMLG